MSNSDNTYLKFGPDPLLSSLPNEFIKCLPPNTPNSNCDLVVGSSIQMIGYCALPEYKQTTYCSCVNNALPCPEFISPPCTNSNFAYKPYSWVVKNPLTNKSKSEICANFPLCINYLNLDGDNQVLSGISQQCGLITNTVANQKNVIFFIIVFVFSVMLVYTIYSDDVPPKELMDQLIQSNLRHN